MSGIVRRRVAPMDADETGSVDSFEAVGFKAVKHQRIPDDEMPDILYSIQYCSSTGRLMETRESAKPLDPKTSNTGLEETSKPTPVIEIRTTVHARYDGGDYYDDPPYPPPEPYWSGSDSDCSDNLPRARRNREPHAKDRTEMVIHSDHLKAALSAVVSYYREFSPEHGIIRAPYQVLVNHWKELELYKLNQSSCHDAEYADTTTKHIDVLLSFLKTTFSERFAAERLRQEDPRGPMATFDNFWTLLKPGTVIYRDRNGTLVPYIISLVRLEGPYDAQGNGEGDNSYYLEFWNIQYSRGLLRRRMKSCIISAWRGERLINSLSVIPERFVTDAAKVAAENIKLGRLYWELAKQPSYMEYDGQVTNGNRASGREYKMTGRVIVDCEGWERFGDEGVLPHFGRPRRNRDNLNLDILPQVQSKCACPVCCNNKSFSPTQNGGQRSDPSPFVNFDKLNPKTDSLPDNASLYLHVLSPTIPAFILSERRWAYIHLSGLGPVRPDLDAFKYLVLDPAIKLTVKSLIGKFAAPSSSTETTPPPAAGRENILTPQTASSSALTPWPTDFVRNKGLGRIFLLHGSPGVGKTCTAECISELARRPLLSLTSGDLSTSMSSSSVERRLSYFLELGERFGALVLLDEADVYLERRRTRDLKRNGLVSVFLRALEYFRGVLFLTTNRVAAFDDAFTSRIHVALYYPELGEDERRRIWGYQFERLEREPSSAAADGSDGGNNQVGGGGGGGGGGNKRFKFYIPQSTKEYAFHHPSVLALKWNGREIRNALQTAVALAETEAAENHPGFSTGGGLSSATTTTTIALMDKHLKAVVGMSSGFKTFMEGVKKKRKGKKAALLRAGVDVDDDDDDENDAVYADEEEDAEHDGEGEEESDDDEHPGSGFSSASENGY
ncbi:hypothetical protein N0V85_003022 [Neurospora sp. IMI 360204]|nr:hypothetical protein N0V85_003022 [Neurospora sp. IMI 360204]